MKKMLVRQSFYQNAPCSYFPLLRIFRSNQQTIFAKLVLKSNLVFRTNAIEDSG